MLHKKNLLFAFSILTLLLILLALRDSKNLIWAQEGSPVQELTGSLNEDGIAIFKAEGLAAGQILYVYADGTGGNLDPLIAVASAEIDRLDTRAQFESRFEQEIASGQDPIVASAAVMDESFLQWDDDSGTGYDARMAFTVPEDGDYLVALASTLSKNTFGGYRLLFGIDAPEVLTGNAEPTGDIITIRDERMSNERAGIQEVTGNLDQNKSSTFFNLVDMTTDDTIDAFVEAANGNLVPILTLEDFAGKPVRISNYLGQEDKTGLSYTFEEPSPNYRLRVDACCEDGDLTEGGFRLLVGLNSPEAAEGNGQEFGQSLIQQPIVAEVGLKLQQITGVDQIAENFGVVATLAMDWTDPGNAFRPDDCQCEFRIFNGEDFVGFATENDMSWPEFTLFNQQGKRFTQNQLVIIRPDGRATYFERFSATLQAPDFDFRMFPFDEQHFFIRIDSLFPEEFFIYSEREGFSEIGDKLGEEEWAISGGEIEFNTEVASTGQPTSSFNFSFEAHRHLSFYFIRIFIPILIILVVSWVTFFLKDYGMRVDVAAGNLLLFIAFNFTISGDLPRLGYLTFLDTIMISTFVVTAMVVVFNVILKRLEAAGRGETALRLDRYTIWIYPIVYAVALGIVILLFT